uniref:Uncharacterized protein n=1 Tax=Anguilla anguilla TaxID=7936 RepID=A0A0E9V6Y5_ANGAN
MFFLLCGVLKLVTLVWGVT